MEVVEVVIDTALEVIDMNALSPSVAMSWASVRPVKARQVSLK
jgi:hypothetical protein